MEGGGLWISCGKLFGIALGFHSPAIFAKYKLSSLKRKNLNGERRTQPRWPRDSDIAVFLILPLSLCNLWILLRQAGYGKAKGFY